MNDLYTLNFAYLIFFLPVVFAFFKRIIACILCIFIIFLLIFEEGKLLLSVLSVMLPVIFSSLILTAILAIFVYLVKRRLRNQKEKKQKAHDDKMIEELKIQYIKERDNHFKNKEENQKKIKQKYAAERETVNIDIKNLNKALKEENQEKEKLEQEIQMINNDLEKETITSLHKDYQSVDIIVLFKEYLDKGRCDNLKECINMYEQEKINTQFNKKINDVEEYSNKTRLEMKQEISETRLDAEQRSLKMEQQILENINQQKQQLDKLGNDVTDIKKTAEARKQLNIDKAYETGGEKGRKEAIKRQEEYDKEVEEKKKKL